MGCTVLPGLFGALVQCLLFVTCVVVLVHKKSRDTTRTWLEFGMDSSKQIIGAGWIHFLNLVFAKKLEMHLTGDQCEWYWVNIMVDTTLGVGVEYVLLACIMYVLKAWLGAGAADFETGTYYKHSNGSFDYGMYLKQLVVWLVVVTGMKVSMLVLMVIAAVHFLTIAHLVLVPFEASDELKLLVVMIATPVVMNAFQFWVVDNIIKKKIHEEEERQPPDGDGRKPSFSSEAGLLDHMERADSRSFTEGAE